jgi:hypothetical protein
MVWIVAYRAFFFFQGVQDENLALCSFVERELRAMKGCICDLIWIVEAIDSSVAIWSWCIFSLGADIIYILRLVYYQHIALFAVSEGEKWLECVLLVFRDVDVLLP